MTTTVEAIYEQGVLRPLKPIPLSEGARVEVIVITSEAPLGEKTAAEILADIAAFPETKTEPPFSGREHDSVLYGKKGAP